jgi:hypothetical protein
MKIRKQVYELMLEDLEQYGVWEFTLDEEGEEGQDEATVRPYTSNGPLDPAEGMFAVKARFNLADGSLMYGCLTPPVAGDTDLGTLQPVLFTHSGHVLFWSGIFKPKPEDLKRNYEMLERTAERLFPMQFSSAVDIIGEPVTGRLNGFLYMGSVNGPVYEIR